MKHSWRAASGLVLAVMLCGCPPATGRHRGDPGDGGGFFPGGPCPLDVSPYAGCSEIGQSCFTDSYCYGSYSSTSCTCTAYGWQCDAPTCDPYGYDAYRPPLDDYVDPSNDGSGDPGCPSTGVSDGASCPSSLGGSICRGGVTSDCDGGTRSLSCACITGTWICDAPSCGLDGG